MTSPTVFASKRFRMSVRVAAVAGVALLVAATGRTPQVRTAAFDDDKVPVLSGNVELTKNGQIPSTPANLPDFVPMLAARTGFKNIIVNQDRSRRFQNETDIAVNPTDSNNIVGGANDYRAGPGYTGFYSTSDGGRTWYDGVLPLPSLTSTGEIPDGAGDPIFVFGADGTVYGAGLGFNRDNSRSGIFVSRSTNKGKTWSRPVANIFSTTDGCVQFWSSSTPGYLHDKEDMIVDNNPSSPFYGRVYVTWTKFTYTSGGSYVESPIFVSWSDTQGKYWSAGTRISTTSSVCDGGTCYANQGSSVVVGPDGTVYVICENYNTPSINQILVQKSTDGGATWSAPVKIDDVYDYSYLPNNTDGRYTLSNANFRINCFPQAAVDQSGKVYCVWADNRNGSSGATNMDVFMRTSSDGAASWSGLMRINNDSTATDQWWPAIAPATGGKVGIMFYDRRDTANTDFNVYMAISKNGVTNWRQKKITNVASDAYAVFGTTNSFIGDYNGIAYGGGKFWPFWTDARHGTTSYGTTDVFAAAVDKIGR